MAANTLRLIDPQPTEEQLSPTSVDLGNGAPAVTHDGGVTRIEHDDGSITISTGDTASEPGDVNDFYRNLADEISEDELALMASDLLTGIELDIDSRKEWMDTRAIGIKMLGLKIEEPRGDIGTTSAPLEGMSTFRHPLLLKATIRFQATARGELLPAAGPVKVRNDLPIRPDVPQSQALAPPTAPPGGGANPPPLSPSSFLGDNGGPPLEPEGQALDDLGSALEKDFNHYLTVTATEYVPDTDRMLFYVGFGGDGFKKVYNCPLRRRPVSESVDAEDIIISNASTDIRNSPRVTHRSKMSRSKLRRMQIAGYYRDVPLTVPNPAFNVTAVEREKSDIGGYKPQPLRPKDATYEVYECYCEWDLDKFATKKFKGKEVPLPYVVTIEKESRKVLAVRRNWGEDDEECLPKQFLVQFPFIRGLGFYGLGLIHILGNLTMALTAITRIMIDNGMFSNFPGFLFSKAAGRQNTNQFRVPVGGGLPVDVPPGVRIQDAFMPIPYKETGAAFANLATHLEEIGNDLGQTAELQIGEGRADVPVGTTMALIEQATKIMDSVHKRLHAAQAEEFGLLKERFKEDPEAFWRHNKRPARQWTIEQFKEALDQRELVPVADPNNPTSLHRIAKATIIDMLVTKYPLDMDRRNALKRIMRIADIDADGLMNAQPNAPPPDPKMAAVSAKAQAEQMKAMIDQAKLQLDAQKQQSDLADSAAERAFKQQQQQFEIYLEKLRVQAEMVIHAHDIHRDNVSAQSDMAVKHAQASHDIMSDHVAGQAEMARGGQVHQQEMTALHHKHLLELATERQKHEQSIQLEREKHAAKLENEKQIAEAKAKAIGPHEEEKAGRESEKHEQQMETNEQKLQMQSEKHKADLKNSTKLADAKAKAMAKPKPSGDK